MTNPDGTVTHSDGRVTNPDGSLRVPPSSGDRRTHSRTQRLDAAGGGTPGQPEVLDPNDNPMTSF